MVVFGLLLFLHFTKIISPLENYLIRISQPALNRLHLSSGKQIEDSVDWKAKADSLQTQINNLVVDSARLQELQSENEQLRAYLNFFNSYKRRAVLANVISQDNFLDAAKYGQNIMIDKGEKDKLIPGLALVNEQGVIIGKVLQTKSNSASACLLINESCKLAVSILNQNKTIGVSAGELGLTVKINFVSQMEKINVSDTVITSGLEKNIPAGLVLGRVSQVDNNENDVWQNITVEPLVDFNNLGVVSVLMP
jgi:rod shape-determining protein MreC